MPLPGVWGRLSVETPLRGVRQSVPTYRLTTHYTRRPMPRAAREAVRLVPVRQRTIRQMLAERLAHRTEHPRRRAAAKTDVQILVRPLRAAVRPIRTLIGRHMRPELHHHGRVLPLAILVPLAARLSLGADVRRGRAARDRARSTAAPSRDRLNPDHVQAAREQLSFLCHAEDVPSRG